MAVENQAHPRDRRDAGNPILKPFWFPMATPNFILINSLCCCFDFNTAFEVGWIHNSAPDFGQTMTIISKRRQSSFLNPTDFTTPLNNNKP